MICYLQHHQNSLETLLNFQCLGLLDLYFFISFAITSILYSILVCHASDFAIAVAILSTYISSAMPTYCLGILPDLQKGTW